MALWRFTNVLVFGYNIVYGFQQSAGGMSMEETQQHLLMCVSVLSTIVPIPVFFSAQNVFVRGVVMSGIKG